MPVPVIISIVLGGLAAVEAASSAVGKIADADRARTKARGAQAEARKAEEITKRLLGGLLVTLLAAGLSVAVFFAMR